MKRIFLVFLFFVISIVLYAQDETNVVLSNITEFTQTMFTDGNLFFTPKFVFGKRYLFL